MVAGEPRRRADHLLAGDAPEVAHLFEVDAGDVTVIHNGIEERGWQVPADEIAHAPARSTARPARRCCSISAGSSGRRACRTCSPRCPGSGAHHPGTRVVVAGKGRHFDELVEQARKLRVRRAVDFVGHLSDRDLRAALAAADAVVLPSRYEPFGIVALEAAAAKAPLVASTAGGLGEVVVHGETGLAFSPGDVAALGAAVTTVLGDAEAARSGRSRAVPAGRGLRLGPDSRSDRRRLPAGQAG